MRNRRLWVAMLVLVLAGPPAAAVDIALDDGQQAAIHLLQARQRLAVEDFAGALELLHAARTHTPEDADVHNLLGFASRRLGRHAAAHAHYAEALRLAPDHLGALEYLGELHLVEGDRAAALALLDRLVALCPEGCEERLELAAAIAAN